MCEHCQARRSWTTELDQDMVLPCEYVEDLDQEDCPQPAVSLVTGRFVEEHLCRFCAAIDSSREDEEADELLRKHGFHNRVDYLLIEDSTEGCSRASCTNLASYAKLIIETWAYCEPHLYSAGHSTRDAR